MESSFTTWMNHNKIAFSFVKRATNLILASHSHLLEYTSYDIVETLLKCLNMNNNKELKERIHTWVMYSLSEYMIYRKYNVFIITSSCCLIATNSNLKIKIKNLLKKITRQDEYNTIEQCVRDIIGMYSSNTSNKDIDN